MASLTVSEQIDAPREVVFDKLADYANAADIYTAVSKIEILTEGEVGVGTSFRETRTMFGKEASEVMTIQAFERPSHILLTAASHGCSYRSSFRLEDRGGGTELTLEFEGRGVSLMGRLLGALMGWMMKSACRKAIAQDFADLKAVIERGPADEEK